MFLRFYGSTVCSLLLPLNKIALFPMIWHSCSPCSICKAGCKPPWPHVFLLSPFLLGWKPFLEIFPALLCFQFEEIHPRTEPHEKKLQANSILAALFLFYKSIYLCACMCACVRARLCLKAAVPTMRSILMSPLWLFLLKKPRSFYRSGENRHRECRQPSLGGETNLETVDKWPSNHVCQFFNEEEVPHKLPSSWKRSCHILLLYYSNTLSGKPEAALGLLKMSCYEFRDLFRDNQIKSNQITSCQEFVSGTCSSDRNCRGRSLHLVVIWDVFFDLFIGSPQTCRSKSSRRWIDASVWRRIPKQ